MLDFIAALESSGNELSEQVWDESVCLYSLVLSRKPKRILEIGVRKGGSALVMALALHHLTERKLIPAGAMIDGIEPKPQLNPAPERQYLLKYINLVVGKSPADIPKQQYDLVHVDADHNERGVTADLAGVTPRLSPDAVIVLHDANFPGVQQALQKYAQAHPRSHVVYAWTKRWERDDQWKGQALIFHGGA